MLKSYSTLKKYKAEQRKVTADEEGKLAGN
jgi:hypothetical protein